jgi:hypothetical protein
LTTRDAAQLLAATYTQQRDDLLRRAARIIEHANGRDLSAPEAEAIETLYVEAGTLDNRVERLQCFYSAASGG